MNLYPNQMIDYVCFIKKIVYIISTSYVTLIPYTFN